jgi:hypothetical protein
VIHLKRNSSINHETVEHADEEKVIPWAEGNGLWGTITGSVSNLFGVDVVTFFVQNPYVCDSAASIATRIGRQVMEVEPVLETLAGAGLLEATDLGGTCVYQLTEDPDRRQTLQQYVTWLQEGFHWARMVMDLPEHG